MSTMKGKCSPCQKRGSGRGSRRMAEERMAEWYNNSRRIDTSVRASHLGLGIYSGCIWDEQHMEADCMLRRVLQLIIRWVGVLLGGRTPRGGTLHLYLTFPPMAGVVELFDAVLQVGVGFNEFLTVCILADNDV